MAGSQDYAPDPRNEAVLVWLNGSLLPRAEARVSIFDAGFGLGDGVWEGLRLHRGRLLFLDAHLDRLFQGAKAIAIDIGMDRPALTAALQLTLQANGMTDGAHVRLMVTRGLKATINQDPRSALGGPTIAIVAEHKVMAPRQTGWGLDLAVSSIRCTPAEMFDMRLNSHSRLNLIRALLEAIGAGADEALMLDPLGFVSSCNATNLFVVKGGEVLTSSGEYCFNGITRANVIALCTRHGLPIHVGDFSLGEAREADEAFVTGTLGGVTPVRSIDGRPLGSAPPGPVTRAVTELYEALKDSSA